MDEGAYGRLFQRVRDATSTPWPPATEAQLAATEARLHFPMPPLLRRLYAGVGNGGFGPGFGILGGIGGAPHPCDLFTEIADAYCGFWGRRRVSLNDVADADIPGKLFSLSDDEWPEYLLPLCYWGCTIEHGIHARTGAIYLIRDFTAYALWAPSLDVWLEQWLDGTLEQE